ncbi:MAG: hypothetical protein QXE33_03440 [Candidatus Micrarchaeaceae archaeon]
MPRQFWNEEQVKRSRELLNAIAGAVDFVLIGGWAVFMYTRQQMSLDLDIAIGYESLEYFRKYGIKDYKNISIKYSVIDGTYVDLFIEDFSDRELPFPVRVILNNYTTIEGIKVVNKELLLLLKLWGYLRADQQKIRKDILDVLALLLYGDIDLEKFKNYIEEYDIPADRSVNVLLEYIDKKPQVQDFIDIGPKELGEKLDGYKLRLRRLFNL